MAPCHVHLTVFVSISSQRVTDLLPAWYYNFRVSMVTWGDPPLSCCESSTVSFVTGNASPLQGLCEGGWARIQQTHLDLKIE